MNTFLDIKPPIKPIKPIKPIIVITLQGKGDSNADYVSVDLFESKICAQEYCDLKTNLVSKYWTSCSIVMESESIETYKSAQ